MSPRPFRSTHPGGRTRLQTLVSRRPVAARSALAASLVLLCAFAAPASAVTPQVRVQVPVITCLPGATVVVALDLDQSLVPLNVSSIEYTMNIDPAFVSSVNLLTDGVVWEWGTPFTNVTPTAVYVAAAGAAGVASSSTRLHSMQFHVSPTAPIGGTMPITFSKLKFNEGNPKAQPSLGLLEIRTTVDAPGALASDALALAPAAPNPIRDGATFRYRIPATNGDAGARLSLYSIDGRRVRTFPLPATAGAERAIFWDARDEAGHPAAAGLYLARLERAGQSIVRRCVVVR